MSKTNEDKWREEALGYWTYVLGNDAPEFCPAGDYEYFESGYSAARKASQVEIDELKNSPMKLKLREENHEFIKQLKDRDQEIAKLEAENEELRSVVVSCNERNRLLVEAGWKNILTIEDRDSQIEKLKAMLVEAKTVMDRCEYGLQPEFYGGKDNGSLKDVRQWLANYDEVKE